MHNTLSLFAFCGVGFKWVGFYFIGWFESIHVDMAVLLDKDIKLLLTLDRTIYPVIYEVRKENIGVRF
jgi:hypothetical protein